MLTEDDAFNSNPAAGFISYRIPAPHVLLGVPARVLDNYQSMTFELKLLVQDDLIGPQMLSCGAKCKITYRKMYTPIIHELAPPVVYFESETYLWFDPKSTTNLIVDLPSDDLPFINSKIGGSMIDFEFNVDFDTYLR